MTMCMLDFIYENNIYTDTNKITNQLLFTIKKTLNSRLYHTPIYHFYYYNIIKSRARKTIEEI